MVTMASLECFRLNRFNNAKKRNPPAYAAYSTNGNMNLDYLNFGKGVK